MQLCTVVAADRNFCSGTKSGRMFHKYHLKEVRAHSGTELVTWTDQADQMTHSLNQPLFLLHFNYRMGIAI